MRSTRTGNCTIPTFGVRGTRAVRTVLRIYDRVQSPIVLTKAPKAFGRVTLRRVCTLYDTCSAACGVPLTLRLSRRRSLSSVHHGIRTNIHDTVVSNDRFPFTRGIGLIGSIISFYRSRSYDIRTRLNHLNNIRSSVDISTRDTFLASPRRTGHFIRLANISDLTMTVNATRNLCDGAPGVSFRQLTRVHRIISIPLILRNTDSIPSRFIHHAVRLNIAGIGITARLGVTFTNTIGT